MGALLLAGAYAATYAGVKIFKNIKKNRCQHQWSEWTEEEEEFMCCTFRRQTRTCSKCGEVDVVDLMNETNTDWPSEIPDGWPGVFVDDI